MADKYEDLLPHNWSRVIKTLSGTSVECYINAKTGKTFFSKEDYEEYIRHVVPDRPRLTKTTSCKDLVKLGEEGRNDAETISSCGIDGRKQQKRRKVDGAGGSNNPSPAGQ